MKNLIAGHTYELEGFEDPDNTQEIQFIHKEKNDVSGKFETFRDGTTNEEVLKMLIDRMYFLQHSFPCRENSIVITNLEESLMWLNKRTEDRKNRGVEGKHLK